MTHINPAFTLLMAGGFMMIPLALLALVAIVIVLDKTYLFWKETRLLAPVLELTESFGFDWDEFDRRMSDLGPKHLFGRFFRVILENRKKPAWWVESRANDEAGRIEKSMGRGLWVLETAVTAAPLLGLLGTIIGMFGAFRLFGSEGLVNPQGVTGGVAQALIATAFGLFIALFSLFAFNFLSRLHATVLDEMERLGTRMIDHIRMDQEGTIQ